jgi:hypothetical protein
MEITDTFGSNIIAHASRFENGILKVNYGAVSTDSDFWLAP